VKRHSRYPDCAFYIGIKVLVHEREADACKFEQKSPRINNKQLKATLMDIENIDGFKIFIFVNKLTL
jgi:hypothetical protein